MKASYQLINPRIAAEMLARTIGNFDNRNPKRSVIERYAHDMKVGKWKENGESIIVDQNGAVIDGQHRLKAIIRSGVTLGFIVVSGVPRESFDTIDSGAKRSDGDILTVLGKKNTKSLAAVLRTIHLYHEIHEKAFFYSGDHPARWSFDVQSALFMYPEAEESVKFVYGRTKESLMHPIGLIGALHYLFGEKDKETRDVFFDKLTKMQFGSDSCPLRALSKAYGNTAAQKAMALNRVVRAAYWVKTWNAFRSGRPLRYLSHSPEHHEFPEII